MRKAAMARNSKDSSNTSEHPAFEDVRILKDYGGRDRVLAVKKK